jgi:hypothetical protein
MPEHPNGRDGTGGLLKKSQRMVNPGLFAPPVPIGLFSFRIRVLRRVRSRLCEAHRSRCHRGVPRGLDTPYFKK